MIGAGAAEPSTQKNIKYGMNFLVKNTKICTLKRTFIDEDIDMVYQGQTHLRVSVKMLYFVVFICCLFSGTWFTYSPTKTTLNICNVVLTSYFIGQNNVGQK